MTKSKRLKQLVKKMTSDSFKDGKIQESKVKLYISQIKKFNLPQAIFLMKEYMKDLKSAQDETTLQIESASALSPAQINKIKSVLGKKNSILETNVTINPSLVGGFKVRIGDMIYDDTVTAKISQIGGAIRT